MNLACVIKNAINKFRNGSIDNLSASESGIIVPEWLKKREICDSDSSFLIDFFNAYEINCFSEITADFINNYGNKSYENVIKVCNLLGLYGVRFLGRNANKYSPNPLNQDLIVNSNESLESIYNLKFTNFHIDVVLNRENEIKIFNFLKSENILTIYQINGVNLSVIASKLNIEINLLKDLFLNAGLQVFSGTSLANIYNKEKSYIVDKFDKPEVFNHSPEENLSIEKMNFSVRTHNLLKKNNLNDLNSIRSLSEEQLWSIKNAGKTFVNEVKITLEKYNYNLSNKKTVLENDEIKTEVVLDERYFYNLFEAALSEDLKNSLNLFKIKNVGQLLELFPDQFYLNDEYCMNPKMFEIEKEIKTYLKNLGFEKYPITYSKIQKEKIYTPELEEILKLNPLNELTCRIQEFEKDYIPTLDKARQFVYNERIKSDNKKTLQV